MYTKIKDYINDAQKIVIIQADNPDGDSLGSALALEATLTEIGKDVYMYCAVDMPTYIHFLTGWSRVMKELPSQFDLSIVVDCSTETLLNKVEASPNFGKLQDIPCIALDHHKEVESVIPYADIVVNKPEYSSTGELLYEIFNSLKYPVNAEAGQALMAAILGDTQGLTNELAAENTYKVMSELIGMGVSRVELEEKRRAASQMPKEIYLYKAELIQKTQFYAKDRLALVTVGLDEIKKYSPLYNPAALVQFDMLQTEGVDVAVVLKYYDDEKRMTGSIRCTPHARIGGELAKAFGGGGHDMASGFKVLNVKGEAILRQQIVAEAEALLAKL